MPACVWNPADIGTSVALSGGNLTWLSSNAGAVSGRATLGYLAGSGGVNAPWQRYFEQTINVQGSGLLGAETGIANEDELLTNFLGGDGTISGTCVEASTGSVFLLTSVFHTFPALIAAAGITVGTYVSATFQKLWWTVDGINFYGDGSGGENPGTNTGGFFPFAGGHSVFQDPYPTGTYKTIYPAFGSRQSGPGGTANFKGPFLHPVAAGFPPWDPSGGASNFFFAA